MAARYYPDSTPFTTLKAVFLINGKVYYQLKDGSWHLITSEPRDLIDAVIALGTIYALQGNLIYRWHGGTSWSKDADIQTVVSLAGDEHGYLYAVNQEGSVYVKVGPTTSWSLLESDIPGHAGTTPPPVWYIVQAGDWLYMIVRKKYNTWGDNARTAAIVEQIKLLNPNGPDIANTGTAWDGNWDHLHAGYKILVPPTS